MSEPRSLAQRKASYNSSVAMKFGVPRTTWQNYKKARVTFGCTAPSGDLFRNHRMSPNTTFKWKYADFEWCVRDAWRQAGEACKEIPTYMRNVKIFFPIIEDVFGIAREDLLRDIRDVTLSRVRHVLIWLMYAQGVEIPSIRKNVCKDYSVVAYGLRKYKPEFERYIGVTGWEDNRNGRLTSYGQGNGKLSTRFPNPPSGDSAEAQA